MGDMNFPDPSASPHESWEWDGEKWAKIMGPGVPETTAIASGVMATGEMVVVNADGTVSVVKETLTPGGDMPAETGEKAEFHASAPGYQTRPNYIMSAYDPNSGKIVVVYVGASQFCHAVVGEILSGDIGNSIVFGAPVVALSSGCSYMSVCFDQSSGNVVIAVKNDGDGNRGKAVVGEVSGDTILFATPVEFEPDPPVLNVSATYDPSVEKVVIAYSHDTNGKAVVGSIDGGTLSFGQPSIFQTGGNPNYIQSAYDPISESTIIVYKGSGGTAVVGKVAGNSMTFGTPVVYDINGGVYHSVAHDHASKKMVIAYRASSSSSGRLVVGTVSGDTISFGVPVDFADIVSGYDVTVMGDPVLGKVVIAYSAGASKQGAVIAGEVSGDSVTFETASIFDSTDVLHPSLCFDPSIKKFGLFYQDYTNLKGYGRVYSPGGTTQDSLDTNLTSENFIGVSKGNYADGDEATVQIAGINADQQGMTVGKQYIQPDGSLDTTEGTPSVAAGTALSATELNIKDLV